MVLFWFKYVYYVICVTCMRWDKCIVSVILRMHVTNNPPGWNCLSLFKPPHLTSPFTHIRAAETVNMCHIKLLAHTMFIVYLFCRGRNSGEKVKKKECETIKPRPSSQSRWRKCSFLCYSLSRHLLTSKSPNQCLLGAGFWELRAPRARQTQIEQIWEYVDDDDTESWCLDLSCLPPDRSLKHTCP